MEMGAIQELAKKRAEDNNGYDNKGVAVKQFARVPTFQIQM